MPRKPLETPYDIDDSLYELTEGLRQRIILAFKGILKPDELTPDDFETVVSLLNETHSYWLHCKYHAPRPAEVRREIKEIEAVAGALLRLLDISLNPPRPPKSEVRHPNYASWARRARATASRDAHLTRADSAGPSPADDTNQSRCDRRSAAKGWVAILANIENWRLDAVDRRHGRHLEVDL